jgi:ribosome-associated protein
MRGTAVNEPIPVPDDELSWSFARSGGPGGQNVNKVASKAVLRWSVLRTTALPADIKSRFLAQQRNRLTQEGDIVISSQRFRDQERNREDCLQKLADMIRQAMTVPKKRHATRPTSGSRKRRLEDKKRRSVVKRDRGRIDD